MVRNSHKNLHKTVKNTKIKFRKISRDDLKLLRDWRNYPGVFEFNTQFTLLNMVNQERWFVDIQQDNSNRIMFTVTKNNKPIGVCGLIHLNKKDRSADVAIIIGDMKSRNKGHGSEILKKLVDYGFSKLKLHRIGAEIFEYNTHSINLFTKLHFSQDATMRDSLYRFGQWWNVYIFSLTKNVYEYHETN